MRRDNKTITSSRFTHCALRIPPRLLPDGHDAFHFIDKPLAGVKRLAAVRGDDFDPERNLVHVYHADAMNEADRFDGPACFDLIEEQIELVLGHPLERFVFDGPDGLSFFITSHDPQKTNHRAHARREVASGKERGFVDRIGCYGELAFQEVWSQYVGGVNANAVSIVDRES